MENRTVKRILYSAYNAIRLCIVAFLLLGFLHDIHGISVDSDTYEKVYTGEFLGEFRYDSLRQLRATLWCDVSFSIIYIILVIAHLAIYRRNALITWSLLIIDIFIVSYFCYMMWYIRQ